MSVSSANLKVLVVDDDPISQAVVSDAVKKLGRFPLCASSGEEAWQIIENEPDLNIVFIDWLMPGMDGAELCRKIKSEITGRYVYSIMVTSKDTKEDVMGGLAAGADDFLPKPVHPGELVSRMQAGERVLRYEAALRREQEKSDNLLRSILPESIAERLKGGEQTISDFHESVSILFVDIVGFTKWCMRMEAGAMMSELTAFFAEFDQEIAAHGLEKIKSIGDAYMVASGLPEYRSDHAHAIVRLAMSIGERVKELNRDRLEPWSIRSGIASGPVIAGVIGQSRFIYDAWGHTVNLASRLESHAPPNGIVLCERTRDLVKDDIPCAEHSVVKPKGLNEQTTWMVG